MYALRHTRLSSRRSSDFIRFDVYEEPDAERPMDFSLWVVDCSDRLLLLDTGFDPVAAAERGQSGGASVVDSLAEAGYDPAQVTDIVLSHLHYDHSGNLEHFPMARVWLQRREYEFWMSPVAGHRQFATVSETGYLEHVETARTDGRLRLIDGDTVIAPGITAVALFGHTPGSQGLFVEGARRPILLASDAAHFDEEWQRDRPFIIYADLVAMLAGYERIRGFADRGARVVTGHDASAADRFPCRTLPSGGVLVDLLG